MNNLEVSGKGKKTKKKAEPGKKREPKKREPKKKTTPEVAEQVQTPAPIIEEEQAPIVDEETRLRDEVANEGAKLAELLAKKFSGKEFNFLFRVKNFV